MADDDKKTASTSSASAAPKAADPASTAAAQPLVAPLTAEDPSRPVAAPTGAAARSFPGFPKAKYHPVYGLRTVNDPNEEAALQPPHNWFDTAEEADMHRTDREAQQVVHYNTRVRVDAATSDAGQAMADDPVVTGQAGVVRNSVTATESLKAGNPEPL